MGASPSTGAVTFDFAGQTQQIGGWSIAEFAGVATSGTNGSGAVRQAVTNQANTVDNLTVTLSAFGDPSNATYGAFAQTNLTAFAVGTGFTQIHEENAGTKPMLKTEWKNSNDTTVDASTTGTNGDWGGIGIEISIPIVTIPNKIYSYQQAVNRAGNY
jgi:hypothetical protein